MPTPDQSIIERAKEVVAKAANAFCDALESTGIVPEPVAHTQLNRALDEAEFMQRRSVMSITEPPEVS